MKVTAEPPTTLEADGQLLSGKLAANKFADKYEEVILSGKLAANKFADKYEEVSNIPVTKQPQCEAQSEQR